MTSHVRGRGEVGHGRTGEDIILVGIHVRIVDARVVVVVPAREGDCLVGRAGLRSTDADLRARWIELGAAEGLGEVKRDDLVADEVVSWGYLGRKRHGDRLTVHYRACASVFVLAEKKKKGERTLRTDVLLVPRGPVRLLSNLVNFEPLGC